MDIGTPQATSVFKPEPWQKAALLDFSPAKLLTGSAGGGKSRVAAENIHLYCLHYPGSDGLIARKTKEDVRKSCMMMMKEVIGDDARVTIRESSLRIEYDNGSIIYLVGMNSDKAREAVRSIGRGKIDIAWMEEAHEFDELDYEEVEGRLRGNAGGWTQVILTTNPNTPLHWINRRMIINEEASVHLSEASDNPYNSKKYHNRLNKLTGVTRKRLRDGIWSMATGIIIDTWRDKVKEGTSNVTELADYVPGGGDVWLFADDGYAGTYDPKAMMFTEKSHPRVFLLAQETSDGTLHVFHESYKVKMLKADHLALLKREILDKGWKLPLHAVYDSASPSLGHNIKTLLKVRNVHPGTKRLDDSVSELRDYVGVDENDVRRVLVHPRCRLLRLEMAAWAYDKHGRYGKYFDNGPDSLRYGVYHIADPSRAKGDIAVQQESEELVEELFSHIDSVWEQYMGDLPV